MQAYPARRQTLKDFNDLQQKYDLENARYRDCDEPINSQLLQATLAIFSTQMAEPDLLYDDRIESVMLWCARAARDLLTTIRMNDADRNGTLLPDITPAVRDDPAPIPKPAMRGPFGGPPDPNFEPYD